MTVKQSDENRLIPILEIESYIDERGTPAHRPINYSKKAYTTYFYISENKLPQIFPEGQMMRFKGGFSVQSFLSKINPYCDLSKAEALEIKWIPIAADSFSEAYPPFHSEMYGMSLTQAYLADITLDMYSFHKFLLLLPNGDLLHGVSKERQKAEQ